MQTLKLRTLALVGLCILLVGFVVGFIVGRATAPPAELPIAKVVRNITTVRDTIKTSAPIAVKQAVIRVDKVRLKINPAKGLLLKQGKDPVEEAVDTPQDSAEVNVPITSKVYQTPNYRAVVSGFRPSLDSLEVYRETQTITETVTKIAPARRKWLALTVGPSVGYNLNGQIVPSLSATLGIIILSK